VFDDIRLADDASAPRAWHVAKVDALISRESPRTW
jgi:hypothetical protein